MKFIQKSMLDSFGVFSFIISFFQVPFPEDHQVSWARKTCLSCATVTTKVHLIHSLSGFALTPLTSGEPRPPSQGMLPDWAYQGHCVRWQVGLLWGVNLVQELLHSLSKLRTALPPKVLSSFFPSSSLRPVLQNDALSTSPSLLPQVPA